MEILCQKVIRLSNFGEIPLVAIGDSAFPQYAWLLKMYNENTRDKQKKVLQQKATWNKGGYEKCVWDVKR